MAIVVALELVFDDDPEPQLATAKAATSASKMVGKSSFMSAP
jgi:hypothetical protein